MFPNQELNRTLFGFAIVEIESAEYVYSVEITKKKCRIFERIYRFKFDKNLWLSYVLNNPYQFVRGQWSRQNFVNYTVYEVCFKEGKVVVRDILRFEDQDNIKCWFTCNNFLMAINRSSKHFYVRNLLTSESNVLKIPEQIKNRYQVKHVSF